MRDLRALLATRTISQQSQHNLYGREAHSMTRDGIPIELAAEPIDIFLTRGVAIALGCAFRGHPIELDEGSREYAEITRAYWYIYAHDEAMYPDLLLPPRHASEVTADVAANSTNGTVRRSTSMDLLLRRVFIGLNALSSDLDHVLAIRALDEDCPRLSALWHDTPSG